MQMNSLSDGTMDERIAYEVSLIKFREAADEN